MNQIAGGIFDTFFALKTPKAAKRARRVQEATQ
jgi:hypothetical protein